MQRVMWLTAILLFSAGMLAGLHIPTADHGGQVKVAYTSAQLTDAPLEVAQAQGRYVAAKEQAPFHYRSCKLAAEISRENLERFNSRTAAFEAGHRPCKVCRP